MGIVARPDTRYLDMLLAGRQRRSAMLASEQEKFLYDPTNAEKALSHIAHSSLPENKSVKTAFGAPLDKIEKGIPEDDPRKGLAKAVYLHSNEIISANPDLHPADALAKAYAEGLNIANQDDRLYKYIREKNSAWFGLSDNNVAEAPGYQEWKSAQPKPEAEHFNPIKSFAIGAVGELALMGLGATVGGLLTKSPVGVSAGARFGSTAARWLGRTLAHSWEKAKVTDIAGAIIKAKTAENVAKTSLYAGAIAVPAFAASDAINNKIQQSDWAQDRPFKAGALGIAADLLAFGAADIAARKVVKSAEKYFINAKTLEAKPTIENIVNTSVAQIGMNNDARVANEVFRKAGLVKEEVENKVFQSKLMTEIESGADLDEAITRTRKFVYESGNEGEKALLTIKAAQRLAEEDKARVIAAANKKKAKKGISEVQALDEATEEVRLAKLSNTVKISDPSFGETPILNKSVVDEAKLKGEISARVKALKEVEQELDNDTTLLNLSTAKDKDVVERLKHIQDLYDRGKISDEAYYRNYMVLENEIRTNPARKKMLDKLPAKESIFDVSGAKVSSSEWITSADKFLEKSINNADPVKGIQDVDKLVHHFIINNTSTTSEREMLNVLSKHTSTERYKAMRNAVIDKYQSDLRGIIYGDREATLNALAADIAEQKKIAELVAKGGGAPEKVPFDAAGKMASASAEAAQAMREGYSGSIRAAEVSKNLEKAGWWEKHQTLGKYAGIASMAAAFYAGDTFISKDEANAGVVKIVPAVLRAYTAKKGVQGTEKELLEGIYKDGISSPVLSKDGYKVEKYQNGLSFTPTMDDVNKTGPLNKFVDAIASPYIKANLLFKQWANPQVILASKTTAAMNNTTADLAAVDNILKDFGNESVKVRERMKPLAAKYFEKMQEMYALKYKAGLYDKVIKGKFKDPEQEQLYALSRRVKKKQLSPEDENLINHMMGERDSINKRVTEEFDPIVKQREVEWNAAVRELAVDTPSTRISLAVEGIGMDVADPWLRRYLTHEEEVAAARIKVLLEGHAKRMVEVGQRPILSKDYIHHASHPDSDFTKVGRIVSEIMDNKNTGIDMAKYHSRSMESLQMMPDIRYVMNKYLGDSNMRIEIADFWNNWKPFWRMAQQRGYSGISNYLEDVSKAFSPVDRYSSWNKWADRLQAFEVARLIALSPSVGFKHAMKVTANLAFGGIGNAVETMPKSFVTAGDMFLQNNLGKVPESLRSQLASAHITTKRLYSVTTDINPYTINEKAWDNLIAKWNENTNFIVNNVELFDRAFSFNSAISMATKQGMTPAQASYLIFDTIIKDNFLSGIHNPSWLRNPKARLVFLFQGTPFKIAEQRAMATYRGVSAFNDAKVELLRQLRADVKEGEQMIKFGLIKDALFSQKDLNGKSYAGQFMRMMLTIGLTMEGANLAGLNLHDHLMHPPFVKMKEQNVSLAMNPLVGAAYSTWKNPEREEDEFWFAELGRKWLQGGGVPSAIRKAMRLSKNDIPEIYQNSPVQYILGIPSAKDED